MKYNHSSSCIRQVEITEAENLSAMGKRVSGKRITHSDNDQVYANHILINPLGNLLGKFLHWP